VCVVGVGSAGALVRVLGANAGALAWSALVSGAVAVALVAWSALSPGRSRLEPLWLAALVLPGSVTGLGALALGPVVSTGLLLVLALMARFAYVAWLPLRQPVERGPLEAAALSGVSSWRTWRRIAWPAARPVAFALAAVVFVLSLGEIGPAVLLSPPGRQSVVLHMFNWMHYGYDETVASLALALFAAAAVAAWIGTYVGRPRHSQVGR
jgi:ABC-type Fe3+ transport system permease subunit